MSGNIRNRPSRIPDHLPVLSSGTHLTPDDGACVMELVSVLAGEPFSDQPHCTDPTLATVARVVNDEMSDRARQTLIPLAADLAEYCGNPHHLAPMIVMQCLEAATQHLPGTHRSLDRHYRRATRHATGNAGERFGCRTLAALSARLYTRGAAQHAVAAAARALRRLPSRQRDAALRAVLTAAMSAVSRSHDKPYKRSITNERKVNEQGHQMNSSCV